MILTFDLGNSDLVVGAFKDDELVAIMRTNTDIYRSVDEYYYTIEKLLLSKKVDLDEITGAIISSVVPQLTRVMQAVARRFLKGNEALVLAPGIKTGLKIRTDNPSEVGADLIADCVGAMAKYSLPLIVVDLGTASKILAVDKNGTFIGCTIMPGVKIATEALVRGTAQLPFVNYQLPKKVIGTNTMDCMNSGIVNGFASLVDGMITRFEKEMGQKCARIITGGFASTIAPACYEKVILDRDVLLYGLKEIYKKNLKG